MKTKTTKKTNRRPYSAEAEALLRPSKRRAAGLFGAAVLQQNRLNFSFLRFVNDLRGSRAATAAGLFDPTFGRLRGNTVLRFLIVDQHVFLLHVGRGVGITLQRSQPQVDFRIDDDTGTAGT